MGRLSICGGGDLYGVAQDERWCAQRICMIVSVQTFCTVRAL